VAVENDLQYPPGYEPHIGESRQYWRDIILGVNDGLVSIFLLVVGVVGAGLLVDQVLITAVAGALAGAVSMASGEYLATKSQDEVLEAELTLERKHIREFRDMEVAQLRGFFEDMAVADEDIDDVVAAFSRSDEVLLNAMASLEFGVIESERRSPYLAMFASGLLFLAGSLPSIVPFLVFDSAGSALIVATVLSLGGLFLVGVIKSRVTDGSWARAGGENMVIAGVGGLIAWFIGQGLGVVFT
jgi:VIT1/CCC1 family predicted Fe2+/Mn2+ transporter